MANLKEDLRALVSEVSEIDNIPDGASFKDLGIDSMMGVEIVAAVERKYQIKISDNELAQFETLDKAYDLVSKKVAAPASASTAAL